jgi:hypothetical protein
MAVANISETSVNLCQTTKRNIPEDFNLHSRRHENLKFYSENSCLLLYTSDSCEKLYSFTESEETWFLLCSG